MRWRVIGLGNRSAGDDGVGPAILDALAGAGVPPGVELTTLADPSGLVELVTGVEAVLLIDAVVDPRQAPGTLVEATEADLSARVVRPLSTHGIDARAALALARTLAPDRIASRIAVLGVVVEPSPGRFGLSRPVEEAMALAVERALALVAGEAWIPSDRR